MQTYLRVSWIVFAGGVLSAGCTSGNYEPNAWTATAEPAAAADASAARDAGALGDAGAVGEAGAPDPVAPEETREQDSRTFTVADPFDPLVDIGLESDRWSGILEGSGYHVEVPKTWNGMLVMYAHGYAGKEAALRVTDPSIRGHLIASGYAWAASSYSKNFYDVRAGVEDTNALALAFLKIAAKHGRTLAQPSKIYIIGHSMGGHVAGAAVEKEALETANHKVRYAGAVPMCGVLGDIELFHYFAAYQVAAQAVAGMPVTAWPVADFMTVQPALVSALFTTFPTATTALGDRLKALVANLTGGQRPAFSEGFAAKRWQDAVWSGFGRDGKVDGILNTDLLDTTEIDYQFDADPAQSPEEKSFNEAIFRIKGEPAANRLRRDGLRWIPVLNGEFDVPVVTIHTLGDLYVPFKMEQIYRKRAQARGSDKWLAQRAIRGTGHCEFTQAEQIAAFDAMVTWEQKGTKPEGDEVLDAGAVIDPSYGCKFTNNTLTEKEMAAPVPINRSALLPCKPAQP